VHELEITVTSARLRRLLVQSQVIATVGLKSDGTDDGTPGGRYVTGHCAVVVYVRRTHDGTLACGVQATGQTTGNV